ncbi:hypothetical protein [Halococcoides cellulosivorans]|uniref:Uncharacterized protein n=1 Tax=Halococcoides cellulosivorans TaxID=1679096 RepID=A0A2R4WZU2_9EURY|nr:hypothetical protein [Halococcoides cellulosivorans]AWB27072.1 hypothetical protein HARCEL1_04795 [Halococcoides cellulosivorans]
MSLARSVATVLLAGLLFASVLGANATVAADQTVLDDEFVADRLTDSEVTASVSESLLDGVGDQQSAFVDDRVESVVEGYVASQTDALVSEVYAYLHGDRAELTLTVETAPLIENLSAAAEQRVREEDPIALVRNYSEGSIEERFAGSTSVTSDDLARLDDNASSYETVRTEVRADIRERVVDELVDELYAEVTTDELLALVIDDYDPTAYSDAEKQRLLDEYDAEIRAALEQRVEQTRGEEIDRRVQSRLDDLAGSVSTDEADNVSAAATAMGGTYVQGVAGEMDYATFDTQVTAAQDTLAVAVGDRVAADLQAQLPAEMALAESMPAEQRSQLDTVASAVQLLDVLVFVFPVIAIAAIGLLFLLTGSIGRTAGVTGVTLTIVGVLTVGGSLIGRSLLADRLAALPEPIGGVIESFALDTIGQVSAQSLWVLVVGLAFVVVAVGVRYRSRTESTVDPMA